MSLGIEYDVYEKIAVMARDSRDYDFIVVDTDSCFNLELSRLFDTADKVIVVTDQTKNLYMQQMRWFPVLMGLIVENIYFYVTSLKKKKIMR